ncbi:MAG: hypothetical protein LBF61_02285 [Azoarcus sp.]|jgi:hypothetical protein|nr:hypothetical protein [Azoarcus sp.]
MDEKEKLLFIENASQVDKKWYRLAETAHRQLIEQMEFEKIDWNEIAQFATMSLYNLCTLSVPCKRVGIKKYEPLNKEAEIERDKRVEIAKNNIFSGKLHTFDSDIPERKATSGEIEIALDDFAAFAVSKGWTLPDGFPRPQAVQTETLKGGIEWPWGNYETALLRKLAQAAEKFWKLYDPDDKTTAPTNKQVCSWLVEDQGVPNRTAEAIATILRADGLPSGPRK